MWWLCLYSLWKEIYENCVSILQLWHANVFTVLLPWTGIKYAKQRLTHEIASEILLTDLRYTNIGAVVHYSLLVSHNFSPVSLCFELESDNISTCIHDFHSCNTFIKVYLFIFVFIQLTLTTLSLRISRRCILGVVLSHSSFNLVLRCAAVLFRPQSCLCIVWSMCLYCLVESSMDFHGKEVILKAAYVALKSLWTFLHLVPPSQKYHLCSGLCNPIWSQTLDFGFIADSLNDSFGLWFWSHTLFLFNKNYDYSLSTIHFSTVWRSIPHASEPREADAPLDKLGSFFSTVKLGKWHL